MTINMCNALNKQIELEAQASFLYLAMASWCDQHALSGSAQFFFRQSEEEKEHMMKIFNYILEMDMSAESPGIDKPPTDFDSIRQIFEDTLAHEQKVTQSISGLVDLAGEENDHSTALFLQWFVEEQREEESLIRGILDKMKLIGDGPQSLYYIDKEVESINHEQPDS